MIGQSGETHDAREMIPPETEAAFLAIGESETGRFFAEDIRLIADECARFTAAPAEWLPSTYGDLLDAHITRGRLLAEQASLIAWAAGLQTVHAPAFASVIGYLAGLAITEGHAAAGNIDGGFVEVASWLLEDSFQTRFGQIVAAGGLEATRAVN